MAGDKGEPVLGYTLEFEKGFQGKEDKDFG
jgi:hypothetical protein